MVKTPSNPCLDQSNAFRCVVSSERVYTSGDIIGTHALCSSTAQRRGEETGGSVATLRVKRTGKKTRVLNIEPFRECSPHWLSCALGSP